MCNHPGVPRIALDTDVLVAAMLGTGAANQLIGAILEGRFELLVGAALYTEHEAVLARDRLFARCRWTIIYLLWRPNLRDESDNQLVELAVAGGAQAVVTRNKRDFRAAELKFENLAVLTPAECLRRTTWQP